MTDQMFVVKYSIDGGRVKSKELSGMDAAFVEKRLRESYKGFRIEVKSVTPKNASLDELLDQTFPQEKIMPEQKKVSSKKVQAAVTAKAKPVKAEKKVVKPEKKAVEKPEKPVKAAKKVVHYPISDLSKMEFVPRWVYANLPERPHQPVEEKFSYVMVYKLVRDLEPNYIKVPCDVLYDMIIRYAAENPNTPIGEWIGPEISKRHKGDLKARLHWCIVETLRRLDMQGS